MSCPLCGEKKYITVRRDQISALSAIWKAEFGFDPFQKSFDGSELRKLSCMECGLIYFEPGIFGDSDFYAQLSQHDWYYETEKWEFDRAIQVIERERPRSLLELGCGSGEFLQKVSTGIDEVLGIDINENARRRAKAKGIEVSGMDIAQLERSFDMIVLFQVLEHLNSPGQLLRGLYDKLNSNGTLVIAVPNPDGYLKDMDLVLLDAPPHHNSGWKKKTFEKLAQMLSMKITSYEIEPIRYVHYQCLLDSAIKKGTKNRLVRKSQSLLAKIVVPFLYLSGGNQKIGQTHMVVMKKEA